MIVIPKNVVVVYALDEEPVATTATVYSTSFMVGSAKAIAEQFMVSGTTPHVKITRQFSNVQDPASDADWASESVDGDESPVSEDFTSTSWTFGGSDPVATVSVKGLYMRYKVVGTASNGSALVSISTMITREVGN
jgi:hypothetical protein